MNPKCVLRDLSPGIYQYVKPGSRHDLVHDLDGTDLHQPIAVRGVESGRFGVENDFTHCEAPRRAMLRSPARDFRLARVIRPGVRWCRSQNAHGVASRYPTSDATLSPRISHGSRPRAQGREPAGP